MKNATAETGQLRGSTKIVQTGQGDDHVADADKKVDPYNPQLEYEWRAADPLIDPCPSWCHAASPEFHHDIESSDADRYHYGIDRKVVLRDLTAEFYSPPKDAGDKATYTLGHVWLYLHRRVRGREPMIHAGLNDSGVGIDVALAEAELIGRALLEMVEAAR